jgi:serine phosphatase RsbU (regulator of sigma subunit)/energy-coupling factor transporter transmembrane protein EcfT
MASPAPEAPSPAVSPADRLAAWVRATMAGRLIAVGTAALLVAVPLQRLLGDLTLLGWLRTAGTLALVAGLVALIWQLFVEVRRRLLWRVRRKLTLSYIFIGFVPALLIIAFFVTAGTFFFFGIGSYILQSGLATQVDHVRFLAQSAALDVQRVPSAGEAVAALERRQASAAGRYPAVSYALVPISQECGGLGFPVDDPFIDTLVTAGPWAHLEPPGVVPAWVPCDGFAGLVVYADYDTVDGAAGAGPGTPRVAMRAAAFSDQPGRHFAVLVDVPLGPALVQQFRDATGIEIGDVTARRVTGDAQARLDNDVPSPAGRLARDTSPTPSVSGFDGALVLTWVAILDYTQWATGEHDTAFVSFRMGLADIYARISETPLMLPGDYTLGETFVILLAVLGGLFLVIQLVTFGMGLALARSITGSVHELFAGTERLRRGDFSHRIAVRSHDQLGELAASFNSMTASIRDLLLQKAEKDRLEQELLIARRIQMSLLPQGVQTFPGVAITGHCEPAREVGGDYYDVLPLDEHRLGLLIADVAGKGTSAALYMAELKGIVQSLSQYHSSPRRLLIDADRILARHLDSRSFITVTYAVVDTRARTLTHARAGHCPLIHVPGPQAASRAPRVLLPDGMVLGLQLDAGEMFARLLEEATLPLATGDLVLLYTDGITEAMNAAGEEFGDVRLAHLVRDHADLPTSEIRNVILREVRVFSGGAAPQDDMTLLVLRMEETPAVLQPGDQAAGTAVVPVPAAAAAGRR